MIWYVIRAPLLYIALIITASFIVVGDCDDNSLRELDVSEISPHICCVPVLTCYYRQ